MGNGGFVKPFAHREAVLSSRIEGAQRIADRIDKLSAA